MPTAAFTSSTNGLAASFNGTSSTDPDGTIASYAWTFGDGTTSTAASPVHTYAAAGTYSVKLTVTDDDGATDDVTQSVSVSVPVGPLAEDAFGRTVTDGWGTADTGGAWTRYGTASIFSVSGGAGQMRVVAGASGPRVALQSVGSTATRATVKVSADKIADGGGSYVSLGGRATGTNDYRAKVKIAPNGVLTLYLVRVVNNAETTLVSTNLGSAFNYTVGSTLQIRLEVTGTSPTTVRAKVWKTSQTEPSAWQLDHDRLDGRAADRRGDRPGQLPDLDGDQPAGDLPVRRPASRSRSLSGGRRHPAKESAVKDGITHSGWASLIWWRGRMKYTIRLGFVP